MRDGMLWIYRGVITQSNVAGGNTLMKITFAESAELQFGMVGPEDYAAGRLIYVNLYSSGGYVVAQMMNNLTVDNQRFPFPTADFSVVVANDGAEHEKKIKIGVGQYIVIGGIALAQNETMTVALEVLIKTAKPTVDTTGSTGTVALVETYNKVI